MPPASQLSQATFSLSPSAIKDWGLRKLLLLRQPWILWIRRKLTRETALDAGTVSVVVPIHNTEPYLRAALDSIRMQRYYDLEIILVDDGSTDRSPIIAAEYVSRDKRFSLIHTNHVGPGAARNVGMRSATGRFLAFVDSDDILPVSAIYRLINALSLSGSDFVVGAFEHLQGTKQWRSPWVKRVHEQSHLGAQLKDVPGITRNVFPWNKLFRKDFFERSIGTFPEGILYEDQVPTANAYVNARSFDVLEDTVYLWRKRETGDSITQNRATTTHLLNRLKVMESVEKIYAERAPKAVYRQWLTKSLFEDMMPFFAVTHLADEEYRGILQRHCRSQWERLHTDEHQSSSEVNQNMVSAVITGDFEALSRLRTR